MLRMLLFRVVDDKGNCVTDAVLKSLVTKLCSELPQDDSVQMISHIEKTRTLVFKGVEQHNIRRIIEATEKLMSSSPLQQAGEDGEEVPLRLRLVLFFNEKL
jgi:predicted TIM-barrel enzyme